MNAAVINKNAKLQRVPEACADTNWSRNTLMKVAAEANAIIRVGRTVRIDMPVALPGVPEQIQPTMFVGCGTRADQGDFECKIKNRVPVSLPCVPDRDGNSANRKVIVLSFIASLL